MTRRALAGPHHHHHGGGRGGFIGPYPYPQYDYGSRELFVVDDTPKEVCNPTPPLKPVPGTYRKANGQYCWPQPRPGATGADPDSPVATPKTNMAVNVLGLGLVGYVIFKLFK